MKRKKKLYVGAAVLFVASLGVSTWWMMADYGPKTYPVDHVMPVDEPGIVIDAGHGGMDGGASAADGMTEKEINLAIARCLQKEVAQYPVQVCMTRETDAGLYTDDARPIRQKKREDLLNRKRIMEEAGADLAISIHLNSFPQDTSVHGAQVFYPSKEEGRTTTRTDEQAATADSKAFAQKVQAALETAIDDGKAREAMAKGDILLFQNPPCKSILVECGFLSSPKEAELLKSQEYQQTLAAAIWKGVNDILGLEKQAEIPLIDSANNRAK